MIKRPIPPSHLSKVLQNLNTGPRLALDRNLKAVRLRMVKDEHVGARHFVKDELPRIRWANPALDIQVDEVTRGIARPEMEVEYENGATKTIDMSHKWSTAITKELMDIAGGDAWKAYRAAAMKAGHPLLPGEDRERVVAASRAVRRDSSAEMLGAPDRPRTGAAAILP
ncbi:hypothetical protein F5J12DRAFT_727417 [Pisolithus orientalis]|uniref:uncharacterized protein n=1 Tax=Pisolithus orientalis TaxID=936130 RepID=UPI0022242C98|nr:uncharacterized protein F5J12DRAFT_727417 [Pisolithus orientalis]KAI5991086.1 hypothetical protein F5J12DRAFT_727417 [Pisolithus orientalis]